MRQVIGSYTPEDRVCFWDSEHDYKGRLWVSCTRLALPSRRVCHKHAGSLSRLHKRRARNKVARATRKAAR